jgi:D-alanyl-D-alanine carboxypeptidase
MAGAEDYRTRIELLLATLHLSEKAFADRALALQPEAEELAVAEIGRDGKEHRLIPPAADAWRAMRTAARTDGVAMEIVSAFRSVERQAEIVRHKLARALTPEEIFAITAPPGYSEHHSGRAVDVTTDGAQALEVEFEQTAAYRWLCEHAGDFSFFLSFPIGNRSGYTFEPWHWCYKQEIA